MAKYDVRVRYTFEGTYKVVAEDCGLVLGGNIHTTRDDDEVTDWKFGSHPDMQSVSATGLKNCGRTSSRPSGDCLMRTV